MRWLLSFLLLFTVAMCPLGCGGGRPDPKDDPYYTGPEEDDPAYLTETPAEAE